MLYSVVNESNLVRHEFLHLWRFFWHVVIFEENYTLSEISFALVFGVYDLWNL